MFHEALPELAVMLFRPMAMGGQGVQTVLNEATFACSMWEGYLEEKGSRRVPRWLEDYGIPRQSIHMCGHASGTSLARSPRRWRRVR